MDCVWRAFLNDHSAQIYWRRFRGIYSRKPHQNQHCPSTNGRLGSRLQQPGDLVHKSKIAAKAECRGYGGTPENPTTQFIALAPICSSHRSQPYPVQWQLRVKCGSPAWASECPELGEEQTSISGGWMSATSHKRKSARHSGSPAAATAPYCWKQTNLKVRLQLRPLQLEDHNLEDLSVLPAIP